MKILKIVILFVFIIFSSCRYNKSINNDLQVVIDSQRKLLNSFGYKPGQKLSAIDYPYYYGGSYITQNNRLAILICGDTNIYKSQIINCIGDSFLYFKECNYSYKELLSIVDQLDIMEQNKINKSDDFLEYIYTLSIPNNRVVVKIVDLTPFKIELFKDSVCNSPAIVFENTEPFPLVE